MQTQKQHIHFMGISGIGMSGIAKVLLQQGIKVSGCDTSIDSKHVQELQNLGCIISSTHRSSICNDLSISTVVYTSAIKPDHPELIAAQTNNIPTLLRADMLAQIMQQKISIAVSGSHGKTSTTALLAHILHYTNQEPTFIIGGHVNSMNTNAQYGTGSYLVAEADESDRSLLKLPKAYSIVTNVDLEHLETYQDFDDVKQTFISFMNNIPDDGLNVVCLDDDGIVDILPQISKRLLSYGQSEQADIQARNIILDKNKSTFDIYQKSTNKMLGSIILPQAGIHYILNATGAIALALYLHTSFNSIKTALETFCGVDRRFTYKGISKLHKAHIYDDYGHHPKEITHALSIAYQNTQNKLVVVFQPHRYSRTKHLWHDFVDTFSNHLIDTLIIADIYPAFEHEIPGITSQNLVHDLKKNNPNMQILHCPVDPDLKILKMLLDRHLNKNDLLLLLGAGKTNKIAAKLLS